MKFMLHVRNLIQRKLLFLIDPVSISLTGTFLLLQEIMKLRSEDELNKAVDLLFALFYFSIHDFTVALLNHIPYLLFKPDK